MIYVSKSNLEQVEYLINQSKQGHHVLFDIDTVRKIFETPSEDDYIGESDVQKIEKHIEQLILQPNLTLKRLYLDRLPAKTFKKVVRTYFNIVENNIFETTEVKH